MYRRPGRGRVLLLVFLALSIFVITLDFRQSPGGSVKRARDLAVSVVAPIQRGFTTVTRPIGNFFSSLGELTHLREENKRLREELARVESDVSRARTLAEENASMREELELKESWLSMKKVPAEVFASSSSNYKWTVSIDAGSADGVEADMAVINAHGLVGKILRVTGGHTSDVLLLIDPDAAASVRIGDVNDTGTLRGNGESQNLTIEFIDTDERVRIGATVKTSGYDGGIFPPGIPIGEVVEVGGEDAAVDRHIEVSPDADFKSLDFVQVLLDTGTRVIGAEKAQRDKAR